MPIHDQSQPERTTEQDYDNYSVALRSLEEVGEARTMMKITPVGQGAEFRSLTGAFGGPVFVILLGQDGSVCFRTVSRTARQRDQK